MLQTSLIFAKECQEYLVQHSVNINSLHVIFPIDSKYLPSNDSIILKWREEKNTELEMEIQKWYT